MSQTQYRNRLIFGFPLFIAGLLFLFMIMTGAPLVLSVAYALIMGAMSLALTMLSHGYKSLLQKRSFNDKKQANQSIDSHQTRTIEIDLPMNQAFDLALDALQTLDKQSVPIADDLLVKLENILPRKQFLNMRHTSRETGHIEAGLKARVMGIPEIFDFSRIHIRLEELNATTTRIYIDSKANRMLDMYDLGKNLHYVNQIALYLRRESQQSRAESRLKDALSDDVDSDLDDSTDQQSSEK